MLRIDFPGYTGEGTLEAMDWDDWFDAFEANQLAFLHQDTTANGSVSRFSKLVRRRPDDELADQRPHQRGTRRKGRTSRVDLNSADAEELDALWGIGPALAKRILDYRRQHGRIGSVDDLRAIDGIDGATVELLKRQSRV